MDIGLNMQASFLLSVLELTRTARVAAASAISGHVVVRAFDTS